MIVIFICVCVSVRIHFSDFLYYYFVYKAMYAVAKRLMVLFMVLIKLMIFHCSNWFYRVLNKTHNFFDCHWNCSCLRALLKQSWLGAPLNMKHNWWTNWWVDELKFRKWIIQMRFLRIHHHWTPLQG